MYAGRAFELLLPQLRYVLPREAFFDTLKEHSTSHSLSHCRLKIMWQSAWDQSISDLGFVLALPYWHNTQWESLEGDPVVNATFISALDLFYLHRLRTILHNTSSVHEGWRYSLWEVKSKVSAGDAVVLVQKLQMLKCFGYLTIQLKMAIVQIGIISSSRICWDAGFSIPKHNNLGSTGSFPLGVLLVFLHRFSCYPIPLSLLLVHLFLSSVRLERNACEDPDKTPRGLIVMWSTKH